MEDLAHGYLDTGEVRLHYVEAWPGQRDSRAGCGRTLVFLHGSPESWFSWRHQIGHFARRHHVVACDLRGFGRSDKPRRREAYAMPRLVADLRALLGHVSGDGPGGVTVVSHDVGGLVAWACASWFPQALGRLVVINCPHPARLREAGPRNPVQALRSSYVALFQLPLLPELLVRALAPLALARITDDPVARRHYRRAISSPGSARGLLGHYRAIPRLRRTPAWPPVNVPTLVVWGTGDPFLGDGLVEGTGALVRDLRVALIRQGGHWVHQRHPDHVNREIERFVTAS